MRRLFLGRLLLALLIGTTPALAGPNPVPAPAPSSIRTQLQRIAPGHKWLTGPSHYPAVAGQPASNCSQALPVVCTFTVEAPYGSFSAIIVDFGNIASTSWQIGQVIASPSASYGSATNTQGIGPQTPTGAILKGWLPVTFTNNGVRESTGPGGPGPSVGLGFGVGSNNGVTSLALTSAANTGATTLNAGSANPLSGIPVQVGMYVSDGPANGCIAPNTVVTGGTGSAPVISPATIAGTSNTGCISGQMVNFSYTPFNPQVYSPVIPPSPNPPQLLTYASNPLPLPSMPRTDGPMFPTQTVNCATNVPTTTVQSVQPLGVTLVGNTSGIVPANTSCTFVTLATVMAGQPAQTGAMRIYLSSLTDIAEGQAVTGSASIPANSFVVGMGTDQTGPWIDLGGGTLNFFSANQLTGTIAAGTALTFTTTAFTSVAAPSGQNILPFISTNGRRLLEIRMTIAGTNTYTAFFPGGAGEARQLGEPYRFYGSALSGVQGILNPGLLSNSNALLTAPSNASTPIMQVHFLMDHPGQEIVWAGDSLPKGETSINGVFPEMASAAAALDSPGQPVAVDGCAHGAAGSAIFVPELLDCIYNADPTIVVLQGSSRADVGSLPGPTQARLDTVAEIARSRGAQVVWETSGEAQVNQVATVPIAGAVTAQTSIPLSGSFGGIAGSGYPVTEQTNGLCSSFPSGTTATLVLTSNGGVPISPFTNPLIMTTSNPITCQAGAYLTLAVMTGSVVSGTKPVTLTAPAYTGAVAGTFIVTDNGGCVAPGSTLVMTQNSTAAALDTNAIGTCPSDTLTLSTVNTVSGLTITNRADDEQLQRLASNNTDAVLDVRGFLSDPGSAPRLWMRTGYSIEGVHYSDYARLCLGVGNVSLAQANASPAWGGPSQTPVPTACPPFIGPTAKQIFQNLFGASQ